jgi:hypothetical protein
MVNETGASFPRRGHLETSSTATRPETAPAPSFRFAGVGTGRPSLRRRRGYDVRSKTCLTVAGYHCVPPCAVGTSSRFRLSAIARSDEVIASSGLACACARARARGDDVDGPRPALGPAHQPRRAGEGAWTRPSESRAQRSAAIAPMRSTTRAPRAATADATTFLPRAVGTPSAFKRSQHRLERHALLTHPADPITELVGDRGGLAEPDALGLLQPRARPSTVATDPRLEAPISAARARGRGARSPQSCFADQRRSIGQFRTRRLLPRVMHR